MRCRSALAAALWASASLPAQTALPEGPGKDKLGKICAGCHELETVVASRRTKLGWQQTTEDMVARGAEGSDEDLTAVVQYLADHFGKVNVNSAAPAELRKTLGLGEKDAAAIVAYREQNGKYKSFEELLKTPGMDPEKLRGKRSLIAFSQ